MRKMADALLYKMRCIQSSLYSPLPLKIFLLYSLSDGKDADTLNTLKVLTP